MEKTVKRLIAGISALAVLSGAFMGGWAFNEYVLKDNSVSMEQKENIADGSNGLVIGESQSNGISLMTTTLSSDEYAVNGVAETAESAATLTATIVPETATNQQVDWLINYQNAESEFATNNILSDCVTLTPSSDGALTATLACLKPFGEKIIVTCTSRDNSEIKATCTLDYSQKIESAALSFGDLAVNLGGTTEITYRINMDNENGPGGATTVSFTKSSVYTIEDNFTYDVYLASGYSLSGASFQFSLDGYQIYTEWAYNTSLVNSSLYFDYYHDINNWSRDDDDGQGSVSFATIGVAGIETYFSNITEGRMYYVVLNINGTYSKYTANSLFECVGYMNYTPVTNVVVDDSVVF